jgi:hypothetical protein
VGILQSTIVLAAWDFRRGLDAEIDRTGSDEELDEGRDSQDPDSNFTVHDWHRVQEVDKGETGDGEPPLTE